jgi:hypothetical protein
MQNVVVPKSEMNTTNQMNGLYPIIRRVRRPLLPVDVAFDQQQAGAKPSIAPQKGAEPTKQQHQPTNDQVTSSEKDN